MADDGGLDLVADFMAITGSSDTVAIQMLEAANFDLEQAVQLFFAADMGGGGGGDGGASGGAAGAPGAPGGRSASPGYDEDGVRAPLPSKVERLYGNDLDPRAMAAAQQQAMARRGQGAGQVDVFRDFRTDAAQPGGGDAGAPGDGAAGSSAQGLSGLFKLPSDLVFNGNVDMAKAQAASEGRWLLLNVQSSTEFASHRLNRDTWAHEALREILKGMFVFFQTSESSSDGRALIKAYRLDPAGGHAGNLGGGPAFLPAILVVDPVTGAQLWHRTGFMDAEKLMEELVPFMDHGPLDAGAAGLAQNNMKRKATAAATAAAAAAPSAGPPGRARMSEEEELELAIAMSMEAGRGGGAGGGAGAAAPMERDNDVGEGGAGMVDDDEAEEAAIWAQIQAAERQAAAAAAASSRKAPEQMSAEALARVPPEPAEGDPEAVRVALRLPDGSRLMRRFRRTDPVAALYDLGLASVKEAAAGRSLIISHAMPGGAVLTDQAQTLDAAGVAGAMLAVKLGD